MFLLSKQISKPNMSFSKLNPSYFQGISLIFGPFDSWEHDSTCAQTIDLEERICAQFDFTEGKC